MKRLPTIIFDLGGVLVENVTLAALAELTGAPAGGESLRHRWLESPSVQAFERGHLGAQEFGSRFVGEWELPISASDFLTRFTGWPRAFWPESLTLLLAALDRLSVEPENACFFDDSAPCVEAALDLGIRAYQVSGPGECRDVLSAAGLCGACPPREST
jgi:FMN phosphatase YigB (HAD superfamily)